MAVNYDIHYGKETEKGLMFLRPLAKNYDWSDSYKTEEIFDLVNPKKWSSALCLENLILVLSILFAVKYLKVFVQKKYYPNSHSNQHILYIGNNALLEQALLRWVAKM